MARCTMDHSSQLTMVSIIYLLGASTCCDKYNKAHIGNNNTFRPVKVFSLTLLKYILYRAISTVSNDNVI